MVEMEIGGLGFDPRNMSPVILLRDKEERNFLPIWIGMFEAAAIAMEIQKFKPPRPMTHDLLKDIIDKMGGKVARVIINDIQKNTFYALIEVKLNDQADEEKKNLEIDARPSDAIAVAVRAAVPIFVSEAVMLQAKMVNMEKDAEESKKFKEFIDNIKPEDFTKYFGHH
jgi:bifunctional DNase/RNase